MRETLLRGVGPAEELQDLEDEARWGGPGSRWSSRARTLLTGTHTHGMTVADMRAPASPACRTHVAVDLDHARFWDLVIDALDRIGEP